MKNWTKESIRKELNELRSACIENGEEYDDSMAFDIADSFLDDNKGLKEAINKMGIPDAMGYVANFIA